MRIIIDMNISRYIATKTSVVNKASFTYWIVRLAVGTVAISLTVMILSDAMMRGFQREISQKIFGFWGHIHVVSAGVRRSFDVIPIKHDTAIYNAIQHLEQVRIDMSISSDEKNNTLGPAVRQTKGGVRHIQKIAHLPGIITTKEFLEGIFAKGVAEDYDWGFLKKHIVEGRVLNIRDTATTRNVLVSSYTAHRLKLKVGDPMIVYFVRKKRQVPVKFHITGIYNTGLEEYDKKFIIVDLKVLQKILQWREDQIGGYEIFIDNLDDLDLLNRYIYIEILPPDMWAETIKEKFPSIFEWLQLQGINERVILGLMLAISIINMMTTMLILILERTRMIGLLKALGMPDRRIRKVFLYYAAKILIWGMIWGNILGFGLAWLQKTFHIIRLNEADYYLSVAPVSLDLWVILLINLMLLGVTLLFLWIPSRLVMRINPVKALLYE